MPGSSIGMLYRVTTFGESHGGAVGVIVEGATPGEPLSPQDIQRELDRRKPGQSGITTPRNEPDEVHILSGVFEGRITGTPILLILYNKDANPEAYANIRELFRPGHADFTYLKKYGLRDHRGSGRASGRETAARVAAGAIARILLGKKGIRIWAYTLQIGSIKADAVDLQSIEDNPVRTCDPAAVPRMMELIERVRAEKDSIGGIVECVVKGVPPGIGDPVFDKLDADLAKAILSIGATKGIEFGAGFRAAAMRGSEHNDPMDGGGFITNNAGGIIGGISSGADILFRTVVKPTSSIALEQRTVGIDGREAVISTEGRHDPCICPRIIPVIEAMTAIVLLDHIKRQEALLA
jgi:chorismate synthase